MRGIDGLPLNLKTENLQLIEDADQVTVYFSVLFPCVSMCNPANLLCPCPPQPDKYGTWPLLNSKSDLHTEYNLGIGEGSEVCFQ